ncbi:hypothetical protein [Streptomyces purpurogeneiscleroticus]|uniref:hypothetical protein n=1 Tax=Streptomyces purpurogeneiscleroticus TaxID=68259 RepID=UPI001CBE3470|nr:hypothetical protein [Streptomyces purpurogeneiscleroticus]
MSFGQGGPYGPGGSGPSASSTPDWAALAEQSEAKGRRKRLLMIGGGVLATLAVAGIVATAVITSNGGSNKPSALPSPEKLPDGPAEPKPTFSDVNVPPPPDPVDYITDPKKDTAPLTTASLFPEKQLAAGGRTYPKATTSATGSCASVAQGGLGPVLTKHGCEKLLRATFSRDGVAVTVGIARFDSKAAAAAVKDEYKPNLAALAGGKVAPFCQATACRTSANAAGRYAYFTIAGYLNGQAVTGSETKALQASRDGAAYAWNRIMQHGRDQADAAAK